MRFERKYRIENRSAASLLQMIRMHPLGFRTLHPDRQINNIYFDSPDMQSLQQNLVGANLRQKARVRWYGEQHAEEKNPVLELKLKHNELGWKESQAVSNFSCGNLAALSQEVMAALDGLLLLEPVLLNSYKRSYLASFDGRFRLTLDSNMQFAALVGRDRFRDFQQSDPALVLELKYEAEDDRGLSEFTQWFPFRQSKNSKYVNGVLLTNY